MGRKADEFLSLSIDEWTDEISSSALQTLETNKINKKHVLPLTEDIQKLQLYFKEKKTR